MQIKLSDALSFTPPACSTQEIFGLLEHHRKYHTPQEIAQYLDILGIHIPPEKVILVAGTNGKGSTCSTLQNLLIAADKNVGFFSSPHILKLNERIKYNGQDITDEDFVTIFNMIQSKLGSCHLSFFEYLTLIAAYYFYYEKSIDFAIFEIGMGGTLDATNAFDHNISVITKLGLDHEDILGKGLRSIAQNKFGIIRKHNAVFYTKLPEEVLDLYNKVQETKDIKSTEAPLLNYYVCNNNDYPEYFIKVDDTSYKLNLLGKRAVENTSLAIEVFKYLVKDYKQYLPAIQNVEWPCRMERMRYKNKDIFLSGDHNPQAIQSLIEILNHFKFNNIYIVIGTCFDKDSNQMIKMLLDQVKNVHLYLTETPTKTLAINQYSDFITNSVEFSSSDPIKTFNQAYNKANKKDLLLITGSLYLTGLIKGHILNNKQS